MASALITSDRNPIIKDVRRAIARGCLTSEGCLVAETFHLLDEALRSDCEIRGVLAAESARGAVERHLGPQGHARVFVLPDTVFGRLSATESSQGVMTLVRPRSWTLDELLRGPSLVLVLDGIQDPGNAGTVVRSAEAFGSTGVIFLKGSVSPYNPKAVRASAGSLFRLPTVHGLEEDLVLPALAQGRIDVYAAMPDARGTLRDADLRGNVAVIIGAEGRGVGERLRAAASGLRIPTSGVESLNAAVAAGIILYEARRQRGEPA